MWSPRLQAKKNINKFLSTTYINNAIGCDLEIVYCLGALGRLKQWARFSQGMKQREEAGEVFREVYAWEWKSDYNW